MTRYLRHIKDETFINELHAGKSFNASYCTTFSAILALLGYNTSPKYYECLKVRLCGMGFDADYSKKFFVIYTSNYVFIVGEDHGTHTIINNLLSAVKYHFQMRDEKEKMFTSFKDLCKTTHEDIVKFANLANNTSENILVNSLDLFDL
jgi:hypothetical protein